MNFDASLIVSVYNKAEELNLVLGALELQSFKNFEVIIADDGSSDDVKDIVDLYKHKNNLFISHLWQPDEGFRKNRILNKSIINTSSNYLIFIDGDCIPHTRFIEGHIYNKEVNTVLCGSRVMLSEEFSRNLKLSDIVNRKLEKFNASLLMDSILGRASRLEEGIYIRNNFLRKMLIKRSVRLLGSNFSIEKSILMKINGFDERYEGPGLGEDSDLEYRLKMINIKFKSVRNIAILYHIYHPKTFESSINRKLFEMIKIHGEYKTKYGIVKYSTVDDFTN